MSVANMTALPPVSPVVRGTWMFVAPVDRSGSGARLFDPARQGRFAIDAPPSGWYGVGLVEDVKRSEDSEFAEVWSGAPATLGARGRSRSSASLSCTFAAWSKLAMALSGGTQQMNLLRVATNASLANSGGSPDATPVLSESTATVLRIAASFALQVGDVVAVDSDYAGQTGFLGLPVPNAYVAKAESVNYDPHLLRRTTFNLSRVIAIAAGTSVNVVTLDRPLPAGDPAGSMRLSVVAGLQDRVGDAYLAEWSALLVMDGIAGDRVLLHYPRLQPVAATTEAHSAVAPGLQRVRPLAQFTALPVVDSNDGNHILCFRSYLPAPGRAL